MNTNTIMVVCPGAEGRLEAEALKAAGLCPVDTGEADILILAAAGLATAAEDATAVEPLIGLFQPLRRAIGRLCHGGQIVIVCDDPQRPAAEAVGAGALRGGLLGICRGLAIELRGQALRTNILALDPQRDRQDAAPLAAALRAMLVPGQTVNGQVIGLSGARGVGLAAY